MWEEDGPVTGKRGCGETEVLRNGFGVERGVQILGENPQLRCFPGQLAMTVTGVQLSPDGIRITLTDRLAAWVALAHSRGQVGKLSGVVSLVGVRLKGERDEIIWAVVFTRCDCGGAFRHG